MHNNNTSHEILISGAPARSMASTAANDIKTINLAALGINTKSSVEFSVNKKGEAIVSMSSEDRNTLKYQRLAFAREVLFDKQKAENYKKTREKSVKTMRQEIVKGELKNIVSYDKTNAQHRTFHCMYDLNKIVATKGTKATHQASDGVSVYKKDEHIYLKGQFKCSSVWSCPVCSAAISEGRKSQLQTAFSNHRINGGGVYQIENNKVTTIEDTTSGIYMMTLTLPHYKKDVLKDLMFSIRKAVKFFKEARIYKELLKEHGFIGEVRALEVTYSEYNGWHPHFHSIYFMDEVLTKKQIKDIKTTLLALWQRSCVKAGLREPNKEHGLDFQDGSQAQKYVNKWGIEHEITKWTSKTGKQDSISPFQLLDLYAHDKASRMQYASLYREYVSAFHGFRQLYWSPGLKEKLGVNDATDEELAEENLNDPEWLGEISAQDWLLIRKHKVYDEKLDTKISFIFYITRLVKEQGIQALHNAIFDIKYGTNPEIINVFYEQYDETELWEPATKEAFSGKVLTDEEQALDQWFKQRLSIPK